MTDCLLLARRRLHAHTHMEFDPRPELIPSVPLLPSICLPAVTLRMNPFISGKRERLLRGAHPHACHVGASPGARDMRTLRMLSSPAWGDTSLATGLLPKAPSCSARFSGAFIAFAVPGQPRASAPASAVTAGLVQAGCHGEAAARAGKPPRLGPPRRAGAAASCGHGDAHGQPVARAGESLPGWHTAPSSESDRPRGAPPQKGLVTGIQPWGPPQGSPSVWGRDPGLRPPQPGNTRTAPLDQPLPGSLYSQISPPKSLSTRMAHK